MGGGGKEEESTQDQCDTIGTSLSCHNDAVISTSLSVLCHCHQSHTFAMCSRSRPNVMKTRSMGGVSKNVLLGV